MKYISVRRGIIGSLLLMTTAGCGALDVSDPTAIEESDVGNATGADLLRRDAVTRLYAAVSVAVPATGLLADEFVGTLEGVLDRRESVLYEQASAGGGGYTQWQEARRAATLALPQLRAHGARSSVEAHIGEMLAVRGLATAALAEGFCPGLPLHDIVDFTPVYGSPLSTEEVFERSLADLDSAVIYAADSATILNLARVARARALLGLGRFTDAANAASQVPTAFVWSAEYDNTSNTGSQINRLGFQAHPGSAKNVSVADKEGGNGLDFITADDPRVTTVEITNFTGTARILTKYPNKGAPIVVASGIEARLIGAEAALSSGGDWIGMLNALRTDGTQTNGVWNPGTGGVRGLPPLVDPGSSKARVDLLFRERAFWLFGTGHRLGDLRRLMSHYGRSSENVFSTGAYFLGGSYGTATSIPFPAARETPFNPAVTGCTSR